jgi:4-alpha-glucanotransferase
VAADSADWSNRASSHSTGRSARHLTFSAGELAAAGLSVGRDGTGPQWFGALPPGVGLFDLFRVDHVVGLFRSWVFPRDGSAARFQPEDEASQIAQGERLLQAVMNAGAGVIAEDLGTIPGFVRKTLTALGLPGFRVMRWERAWKAPGLPFIDPADYPRLSVATSGTHDTETLAEWWQNANEPERRAALAAAWRPGHSLQPEPRPDDVRPMCATRSTRSSRRVGSPPACQDVFGWTDRINVPALIDDSNWTWRRGPSTGSTRSRRLPSASGPSAAGPSGTRASDSGARAHVD